MEDQDLGRESAKLYRDLEDDLAPLLGPDPQPSLAFLSFVPVGARNHMALTTLLQDRLVVGRQHGLFRKKFGSLTVPFSTIKDVSASTSAADPTLGGNPAVTIEGDRPLVIAIPPKGSPLAEGVRGAIVDGMASR